MSYLEKTARKLHPILLEIKRRMVPEKTVKERMRKNVLAKGKPETIDSVHEDGLSAIDESSEAGKKQAADMKNILGYLNQSEWTQTLSIGSIM